MLAWKEKEMIGEYKNAVERSDHWTPSWHRAFLGESYEP